MVRIYQTPVFIPESQIYLSYNRMGEEKKGKGLMHSVAELITKEHVWPQTALG
jgi:hypothetical protein